MTRPCGDAAVVWHDHRLGAGPGSRAVLRELVLGGDGQPGGPTVLLLPGFARTISSLSMLALQLAWNGATVYRLEPPDHRGIADGSIRRFTMSGYRDALALALDHLGPERPSAVVAFSLAFRVALRAVAEGGDVARLMGISGMVNPWSTLYRAIGLDLSLPVASLPETAVFEGHEVQRDPFVVDLVRAAWLTHRTACEEAARCTVPLELVLGTEDRWVDEADCRELLDAWAGPARITLLPDAEHDVGRNKAAALHLADYVTAWALDGARSATRAPLDLLMAHGIEERRHDREHQLAGRSDAPARESETAP